MTTGEHVRGTAAFFPTDDGQVVSPDFPTVDSAVLAGDEKGVTREAAEFLSVAGVRTVGEWERLQKLLEQYYAGSGVALTWELHLEHLQRFISWAREKRPDGTARFTRAANFGDWRIFKAATGQSWIKPTQVFPEGGLGS